MMEGSAPTSRASREAQEGSSPAVAAEAAPVSSSSSAAAAEEITAVQSFPSLVPFPFLAPVLDLLLSPRGLLLLAAGTLLGYLFGSVSHNGGGGPGVSQPPLSVTRAGMVGTAALPGGGGGGPASSSGAADPGVLPADCSTYPPIPVVVLAHNNPTLVGSLVRQLRTCFNATVIIADLTSKFQPMLDYLEEERRRGDPMVTVETVPNFGPRGFFLDKKLHPLIARLPRFFAFTDGDIRLGDNTPRNFLCALAHMTQRTRQPKAALALTLRDKRRMWQHTNYYRELPIWGWERMFYSPVVATPDWPEMDGYVFNAPADTIFAVYDKGQMSCGGEQYPGLRCFSARAVRVAGKFSARHVPWYPSVYKTWLKGEIAAVFGGGPGGTIATMLWENGYFRREKDVALFNDSMLELALEAAGGGETKKTGEEEDVEPDEDLSNARCGGSGDVFPIPGVTRLVEPANTSLLIYQHQPQEVPGRMLAWDEEEIREVLARLPVDTYE